MLHWLWRGVLILIATALYSQVWRTWRRATRLSQLTPEGRRHFLVILSWGPHLSRSREARYFTPAGRDGFRHMRSFTWLGFATLVVLLLTW